MRTSSHLLFLSAIALSISALGLHAQTDVSASVYGAFSSSTTANDTLESPSNQAGAQFALRHIWNPLAGVEATYSYNRANQAYTSSFTPPCQVGGIGLCGPTTTTAAIPANAHETTGDWVASLKLANLRPFALAGGGVLLNVPATGTVTATQVSCAINDPLCSETTTTITTATQTKAVFVYGAGLDWTALPHLGLRFQYRGNLYKAPDLATVFASTNTFTHNSEPMLGAFFRF
jgi:opacity protein-like surface antigen